MSPRSVRYLAFIAAVLTVVACSPPSASEPTEEVRSTPVTVLGSPAAVAAVTPVPVQESSTSVPTELVPPESPQGDVASGFTEDGSPYRGDPGAPVTLTEYSDFQ